MADDDDARVAVPEQAYTEDESKPMEMESGDLKSVASSVRDMEDTRTKPFVVLVAVAAALGGLIFGFDIGGAGATFVMPGFREHFGWGTFIISYLVILVFFFFFLPSL
jgi:hypothetical protein